MSAEPIHLFPRSRRVVAIHPALLRVVAAAEGMTADEIDAAYRQVWDARRRSEGLEIVPPWPLGGLEEIEGY